MAKQTPEEVQAKKLEKARKALEADRETRMKAFKEGLEALSRDHRVYLKDETLESINKFFGLDLKANLQMYTKD